MQQNDQLARKKHDAKQYANVNDPSKLMYNAKLSDVHFVWLTFAVLTSALHLEIIVLMENA